MSDESRAKIEAEHAARIAEWIAISEAKQAAIEAEYAPIGAKQAAALKAELAEVEAKYAAEAEAEAEAELAEMEAECAAIEAELAAIEAELAAIVAKQAAEAEAELATHKAAFLNLKERQALINVGRKGVTEDGELIGEYNLYPEKHSEFCLGVVRLQLLATVATKHSAVNASFQLQRPGVVKLCYSNATCFSGDELFFSDCRVSTSESTMWENEVNDLQQLDLGEVNIFGVMGRDLTTLPYNWKEYPSTNGVCSKEELTLLAIHPYMPEEMIAFPKYRKNAEQVVTKVSNDCYKVFGENQEFVLTIVGTVNYADSENNICYVGTFSVFGKAV
jgi:hypothetical protein